MPAVPGSELLEWSAGWSADGRSIYVYRPTGPVSSDVYLVDVTSGQKKLWKRIMPPDPAGSFGIGQLQINGDGKSYMYSLWRVLSDLFLVEGLK